MSQTKLDAIRTHLQASADVKIRVAEVCAADVVRAADLIAACLEQGGKILLCGNGGSAADCQHMATEFVSRLTGDFERPGLPAISLVTDTSFLTAYSNDVDFEGVFARQVQVLGRPGDVLIAISTSGKSRNVIRAVEESRRVGMRVVTLSGEGGNLAQMSDVAICVPSVSTMHIQEAHLAIEHAMCYVVERMLCPGGAFAAAADKRRAGA